MPASSPGRRSEGTQRPPQAGRGQQRARQGERDGTRRCVLPGPGVREGSGPGRVPPWLQPPPPAPLPAPRSPLLPSRLLPRHLPQLLPRRVAGALAARRAPGGEGGTARGPSAQASGPGAKVLPAARGGQAGATCRSPPALASSPPGIAAPEDGAAARLAPKAGTLRRELKVGTSRAAARRDPAPASGAPGSARGRGPGVPCGCQGARERPPGPCGMHPCGRGLVQPRIHSRGPRDAKCALTLHAGFWGSPGRSWTAEESFSCWFTVSRQGRRHPHQRASLSRSLIKNSGRAYGPPTVCKALKTVP